MRKLKERVFNQTRSSDLRGLELAATYHLRSSLPGVACPALFGFQLSEYHPRWANHPQVWLARWRMFGLPGAKDTLAALPSWLAGIETREAPPRQAGIGLTY